MTEGRELCRSSWVKGRSIPYVARGRGPVYLGVSEVWVWVRITQDVFVRKSGVGGENHPMVFEYRRVSESAREFVA